MLWRRKPWVPVALVIISICYSVLATEHTVAMRSWLALHSNSLPPRFLAGEFWYALLLAPISLVSGALGLRLNVTVGVLTGCEILMLVTWYLVTGFWSIDLRTGTIFPVIAGAIISLALQLPVWGLAQLATRLLRPAA
jgi:hypothetical protein